jgi:hypothetical protein
LVTPEQSRRIPEEETKDSELFFARTEAIWPKAPPEFRPTGLSGGRGVDGDGDVSVLRQHLFSRYPFEW